MVRKIAGPASCIAAPMAFGTWSGVSTSTRSTKLSITKALSIPTASAMKGAITQITFMLSRL